MRPELERRIAEMAADRTSGASEILDEVVAILRDAIAAGDDVAAAAAAVCAAQPSMAPVWNAAEAAVDWKADPDRLDRFARLVDRAPEAVARFALGVLGTGHPPGAPLRIVTFSYSRSVLRVLEHIARQRLVQVACSEGRPAFEGRRLAERLAAAGIPVTFFTDAAIGHALDAADEVVVGADAVTPEWFLNKSGTRMLAAAAQQQGVGVYLVASRDKVLTSAGGARLVVRESSTAEVWDQPPTGVAIRNPYFERIPLSLVSAVISDIGVLDPSDVQNISVIDSYNMLYKSSYDR